MSTLYAGTFLKFYCILTLLNTAYFFLLHLAFIAEGGGENETTRAAMELIFTRAVGFRKILQPSNFLGMKNLTSLLMLSPLFVYYLRETVILQGCFQEAPFFKSLRITISKVEGGCLRLRCLRSITNQFRFDLNTAPAVRS